MARWTAGPPSRRASPLEKKLLIHSTARRLLRPGTEPAGPLGPTPGGPSPSVRSFGHPRTSRALRPRRGRIPLFTSVLLSLSPDRFEPSPRKHSSCTVIRLGFLLRVHLEPTGHKAMTARNPRARLELNRRRARLGRRTEHARASSRAQGHVEACSWGSHAAGTRRRRGPHPTAKGHRSRLAQLGCNFH